MVTYRTGSNPIEIGDLGSKVKVTVIEYQFFSLQFSVNFPTVDLSSLISDKSEILFAA